MRSLWEATKLFSGNVMLVMIMSGRLVLDIGPMLPARVNLSAHSAVGTDCRKPTILLIATQK